MEEMVKSTTYWEDQIPGGSTETKLLASRRNNVVLSTALYRKPSN